MNFQKAHTKSHVLPLKIYLGVGGFLIFLTLLMEGSMLFEKTCSSCHKLDSRHVGPPLRGVTSFRSNNFIMNMMLNPEENVRKHPDIRALQKNYQTIMTHQYFKKEKARKILEYLRKIASNN